jgi:hypothetical protein
MIEKSEVFIFYKVKQKKNNILIDNKKNLSEINIIKYSMEAFAIKYLMFQ